MLRHAIVAPAILVLGCGAAAPPTRTAPALQPAATAEPTAATGSASASAAATPPAAEPGTRYRIGDYVVYRYDGSALPAPVTLTEEIVAQQGLRLEIQVTARRGTEQRRWIQVVTDTPENRSNDVVDELYLVENGQRKRLANENDADVYRLYQWIIPPVEGPLRDVQKTERAVDVAGQRYELTCATGRQTIDGKEADVEMCDGEAFLWTKAKTMMRAVDGGEVLYRVSVQDAGRR